MKRIALLVVSLAAAVAGCASPTGPAPAARDDDDARNAAHDAARAAAARARLEAATAVGRVDKLAAN